MRSSFWFATFCTDAFVVSGPPWQAMHLPFPVNRFSPSFSWEVSAAVFPSKNRSNRESSARRVCSYPWIARPQKKEKLNSIRVISLVFVAGDEQVRKFSELFSSSTSFWNVTHCLEFH